MEGTIALAQSISRIPRSDKPLRSTAIKRSGAVDSSLRRVEQRQPQGFVATRAKRYDEFLSAANREDDAMLFLVEPAVEYKETFLEGLREFQREGLLLQYDLPSITRDFESFLRRVRNEKDKTKLRPDAIPATTYWLIERDEYGQERFVGNLSLRHELNDFLFRIAGHIGYQIRPSLRSRGYGKRILQLGLQEAKVLGIQRALLTCDETNTASKKVIEFNGGQFENALPVEGSPLKKMRYWIDLS
jgi:predicted acetyltransferase